MRNLPVQFRRALWLAAVPWVLAVILAGVLRSGLVVNPVLAWQADADLGTLVLLAGLALSSLACLGCGFSWYWLRWNARALAVEQERQAQAHKRFIRRLDHEMKNPLATLQVSLSSLKRGPGQTLATAQEQVARLRHLLQGLRKLSDLGTYAIGGEAIDLSGLLGKAIAAAKSVPGREERGIELHPQRFPWAPPPLIGDEDLLLLAFYNLIDNACKFGGPDGSVQVRVGEDGAAVVVEVADDGPGVDEEDLPHIFEELYRGEGTRGIEGSGLGLALVKKIVERHGGSLAVRSRQGQGTVFIVRLPAKSSR